MFLVEECLILWNVEPMHFLRKYFYHSSLPSKNFKKARRSLRFFFFDCAKNTKYHVKWRPLKYIILIYIIISTKRKLYFLPTKFIISMMNIDKKYIITTLLQLFI